MVWSFSGEQTCHKLGEIRGKNVPLHHDAIKLDNDGEEEARNKDDILEKDESNRWEPFSTEPKYDVERHNPPCEVADKI